jgi:hypothetical protein
LGVCLLISFFIISPQQDIIHECLLSLVNHLYWCSIPIVNTVADCLDTLAQVYTEQLDHEGVKKKFIYKHLQKKYSPTYIDYCTGSIDSYYRRIECSFEIL